MKFHVMPIAALTPDQLDAWAGLRQHSTVFEGAFFAPAFAQLVAQSRGDARVVMLEEGGHPMGFFPFQGGGKLGIGEPIGGRMSDYHGVITAPGTEFDPVGLVRAAGLRSWPFDHLVAASGVFDRFVETRAESTVMNLANGYEAYRAEQAKRTDIFKITQRKFRNMERDVGPLRFEAHTTSQQAFEMLALWKSQQYMESSLIDNFRIPWIRDLLERVKATQQPRFAGMLSTLHAGDRLVAVHLGMRSEVVWHYWLTTYDREFGKYSPGNILLLKMAEHAPTIGIRKIDLGRGEARYKQQLANDVVLVGEGAVDAHGIFRVARRTIFQGAQLLRRSEPVHAVGSWCRRQLRVLKNRRAEGVSGT